MELYEVLDKAADVMTERGHAKFTQEDHRGRVCLAGAISIAVIGKPYALVEDVVPAIKVCDSLINPSLGLGSYYPAVEWNNLGKTTEQEVIDLLRRAAIKAKEERTTSNA